ncbi:MAG: nicotinate-nucleotide adenylyltransferase [Nitrospirae bacterium]|nr:nicotinate-nucleotide adenylyltransferase [Nitrospirota bacterium]
MGIFGGTFNPIHYGHLKAAEEVRKKCGLEKILFVPSGNPPLKSQNLVEAKLRYEMTAIAVSSNSHFEVSDIETARSGKSYTVDTVSRLMRLYPKDELFLILGIDAFLDLPLWRHPDKILSSINIIVITRPGLDISDINKSPYLLEAMAHRVKRQEHFELKLKNGGAAELISVTPYAISSTLIRKRIKENKAIRDFVPLKIAAYIKQNNLYQ